MYFQEKHTVLQYIFDGLEQCGTAEQHTDIISSVKVNHVILSFYRNWCVNSFDSLAKMTCFSTHPSLFSFFCAIFKILKKVDNFSTFFDDISQNIMANNFWSSFSRNEEKKMKNESKFNNAVAAKQKKIIRQTELFTDKNS